MVYCPACGAEIGENIAFCPNCGAPVSGEKKIQMAQPEHAQFQQPQEPLPQLVQRNYLIWLLLSFVTGIFGLIYIYIVFEDLRNLDKHPKPKGVKSTYIDQSQYILYIVLYVLGLAIIANYLIYSKKYGLFNDYLDTHPQKQTNLPSRNYIKLMIGRDVLLILMTGFMIAGSLLIGLSYDYGGYLTIVEIGPPTTAMLTLVPLLAMLFSIGGLCFIGVMIIGIYLFVLDYRWQEAMNERVRMIDPNARMKTLF